MNRYIEAPAEIPYGQRPMVFLAGGISGCPDWQRPFADKLLTRSPLLSVLNPRRQNFPMTDPTAAEAQITWEHHALRAAQAVSFWFTNTSVQPIVLYELGAWSMTHKRMFIGIEPGYAREQDVRIQTKLARPDMSARIVSSLDDLAEQITAWAGIFLDAQPLPRPRPDGLY